MTSATGVVRIVSEVTVKPSSAGITGNEAPADHPRRCDLSLWDLSMLSLHQIQKGHLFSLAPGDPPLEAIVNRLTSSLSIALWHFYPLAGRLATEMDPEGNGTFVYIDCDDRGSKFILAAAEGISVADVLDPSKDVPGFVKDLFPYDRAVNYDGLSIPLLAVQLTKLDDGVFLGCSFNHSVGDGTAFWSFFNSWAEISRSLNGSGGLVFPRITKPPVHERWFVEGTSPPIRISLNEESEFIERYSPPPLREKFFHFTGDAIAQLKKKANEGRNMANISSFQALSAFIWRCLMRLRNFPEDQKVVCRMAINNRGRLRPQLPEAYFGNSIYVIPTETTAGKLLGNNLGWAAALLNQSVASHTDKAIREMVDKWMTSPMVYRISEMVVFSALMSSSPRFDMYGCDFGWGKAQALRSGSANKFDGQIAAFPGREGGGSIDLQVCLLPEVMELLESDEEFQQVVSR